MWNIYSSLPSRARSQMFSSCLLVMRHCATSGGVVHPTPHLADDERDCSERGEGSE